MLVADTNILLRLLLKDDIDQEERAWRAIHKVEKAGQRLFLPQLVVQECIWVLQFDKMVPRARIAAELEKLFEIEVFQIEGLPRLRRALRLYAAQAVDFVDAYIAMAGQESGHEGVLSFDRDMAKLGVHWVKP
jgi:predicted nucleic-acid-binding protein